MTTAAAERAAPPRTSRPTKAPPRKPTKAPPRKPAQAPARQSARARAPAPATPPPASSRSESEAAKTTRPGRPLGHAVVAAERAMHRNSLHLQVPVVGELRLPAAEELVFLGGVAALALAGMLEWPVAVLLGIGHQLAAGRRNKVVRAFGEALEEA